MAAGPSRERFTSNLSIAYPEEGVQPSDDVLVQQMHDVDAEITFAAELANLAFALDDLNSYFTYNGSTGLAASTGVMRVYAPSFGGRIFVPTFSQTLAAGNWLVMSVPEGPWSGNVNAFSVYTTTSVTHSRNIIPIGHRDPTLNTFYFLIGQTKGYANYP